MNEYLAPLRDMRFILDQLVDLPALAALPGCEDAAPDLVAAIFDEAAKFSAGVLAPLNEVGDRQGCRLDGIEVVTPDGWRQAYRDFREAGWVGLGLPADAGGQGLPKIVAAPVTEMWFSANLAFSMLPPMAAGAFETLAGAADDTLKALYLPRLASGEWAATMDLTEPNAGSDLGAIKTRAEPQADGSYRLFGQKIFITYGDHDLADNIVHLVLARTPEAPAGVGGISLFVVPKYLPQADGTLGQRNDMRCIAVEHKLGIRGSPTCTMSYGDDGGAVGYLVGQLHRGLEYMFVMVNESRFNVGLQGIAQAERAYQKALAFARERRQGRDAATGERNVPICRHPDVKRMLLTMRAKLMGARMLAYCAAAWFDRARCEPQAEVAQRYRALVDLTMPVVKAWSTELGSEVADCGIQIHGGMGFVEETGATQPLRDVRITRIYEGTTGIQANDLISRKLLRDRGAAFGLLLAEIRASLPADGVPAELAGALATAIGSLENSVAWILASTDVPRQVLPGATAFLSQLGLVCGAWQMARAAAAASAQLRGGAGDAVYLQGVVDLARFYACHLLPEAQTCATVLMAGGASVTGYDEAAL